MPPQTLPPPHSPSPGAAIVYTTTNNFAFRYLDGEQGPLGDANNSNSFGFFRERLTDTHSAERDNRFKRRKTLSQPEISRPETMTGKQPHAPPPPTHTPCPTPPHPKHRKTEAEAYVLRLSLGLGREEEDLGHTLQCMYARCSVARCALEFRFGLLRSSKNRIDFLKDEARRKKLLAKF